MLDQPFCETTCYFDTVQQFFIMPRHKTAQQKADEVKHKEESTRIMNQKLRLIQMVQEYPLIYDKGHPDHLNSEMKTVIWEQIATELNEEGTFK